MYLFVLEALAPTPQDYILYKHRTRHVKFYWLEKIHCNADITRMSEEKEKYLDSTSLKTPTPIKLMFGTLFVNCAEFQK